MKIDPVQRHLLFRQGGAVTLDGRLLRKQTETDQDAWERGGELVEDRFSVTPIGCWFGEILHRRLISETCNLFSPAEQLHSCWRTVAQPSCVRIRTQRRLLLVALVGFSLGKTLSGWF